MFVVIGTTTVDLIVRGAPAITGVGDGFRSDNLVFCEKPLLLLLGGNGGISAYGLAKLGVTTALCSSVGLDDLGNWLVEKLQDQRIDLSGLIRHPELATSSSTILLDSDENQAVFHHKGATETLNLIPAHRELYRKAEVLLASSYPLFPEMRTGGFEAALRLTHDAGGITALDIGPAIDNPVTTAEISHLFPFLDYLIGNTHELISCTGCRNWQSAATELLEKGCRNVVVKRGADGSSFRSENNYLDVPAFPVSTQFSVGAGDLFNAGFLYSIWKGRSGLEAMRFGSALAALTVRQEHGIFGAPSAEKIEQLLN